ncbi:MAG: tetraacyldisaccharide 4'-kinase [Candidatus Omnitrophica bacterium]|nr:tetraacyldisaccharide 4'-kinase [Candidatus Omnitrophota bacterium]
MIKYLYAVAMGNKQGFCASLARGVLFVSSLIYGLLIRALMMCASLRKKKLGCKVVSIGNITVGGTGKTPLVEYVTRWLVQQGHAVAILTRGYKKSRASTQYSPLNTQYSNIGDEPSMLQQKFPQVPVIVNADRICAAEKAMHDYRSGVVVLDDGFQQWAIAKDIEIVTIDALNPFGNGHMLPRGILREPLSSLSRASFFVITRSDLVQTLEPIKEVLKRYNPQALVALAVYRPIDFYDVLKDKTLALQELHGKTVGLVSGIADPQSFEALVKKNEMTIGFSLRFADHHVFVKQDLEKIAHYARLHRIDTLVTTEKDAVRLKWLGVESEALRLVALRIKLAIIEHEEELHTRLHRLFSA